MTSVTRPCRAIAWLSGAALMNCGLAPTTVRTLRAIFRPIAPRCCSRRRRGLVPLASRIFLDQLRVIEKILVTIDAPGNEIVVRLSPRYGLAKAILYARMR